MADTPVTPPTTTVDPTSIVDPSKLQAFIDQQDEVAKINEKVGKSVSDLNVIIEAATGKYDLWAAVCKTTRGELLATGTDLEKVQAKMVESTISIGQTIVAAMGLTQAVQGLGKTFTDFGGSASAGLGGLADSFGAITNVSKEFTKLVPGISELADMVTGFGKAALQATDHTTQLEQGFIQMLVTSGDLYDSNTNLLSSVNNLDGGLKDFIDRTYDVAKATGVASPQIRKFMEEVSSVKGLRGAIVDDGTNAIEAATRVAATTSGGLNTVKTELIRAYENFGVSADKASSVLTYVANLTDVTERLGLNFKDAQKAVEDTADKFQYLGNNSMAALKVLNDFAPAFRVAGASAKQASEMVQTMSDGISNMNTASKAFMSSRSGGPGGLQGAFKIDELISKGKYDEVVKMAETSLRKQFGGKIVTQEQASQSQSAASQYQKQLSYMKTNGFGNLSNERGAKRFFDAMSKGPISGSAAKGMIEGDGALETSLNAGRSVQDRGNTRVNQVAEDVRRVGTFSEMDLARRTRDAIGTTGGGAMARDVKENIATSSSQAVLGNDRRGGIQNAGLDAFLKLSENLKHSKDMLMSSIDDKKAPVTPAKAKNAPITLEQAKNAPITLEQAQQSPEAAEQYQKQRQRQFLKSGGFAKNEKEAEALLNALSKTPGDQAGPAAKMSLARAQAGRPISTAAAAVSGLIADNKKTPGTPAATSVQFPSEMKISGELVTKCPDCGTKSDARVEKAVLERVIRQNHPKG